MFAKIKDKNLLNFISNIKSRINIRKIDIAPKGDYLLTYSIKNDFVIVFSSWLIIISSLENEFKIFIFSSPYLFFY